MTDEEIDRWLESARVVRTIMFVDVADSVRLAQQPGFIGRWWKLVKHTEAEILPRIGGRLVRGHGDDMLIAFEDARCAVKVAFELQHVAQHINRDLPDDSRINLRIACHATELIDAKVDLLGHGVNVAALIMKSARPGEILVSGSVRAAIGSVLDADLHDLGDRYVDELGTDRVVDMGECYLRGIKETVRLYRLGPPGIGPVMMPAAPDQPLSPTLAVVPFAHRFGSSEHAVIGEVIADDVIASMGQSRVLQVISRLSTTQFRHRAASAREVGEVLGAGYVLSGTYRVSGSIIAGTAELFCLQQNEVVWAAPVRGEVEGVLCGQDEMIPTIVKEVCAAVISQQLRRARSAEMPTLKSYTLLLAAIGMMHQGHGADFQRAREMLETLVERVRRQPVPYAWLAKWHVLNYTRGYSANAALGARVALDCTRRALDLDPDCSLALTIEGFAYTNLLKQFEVGQMRYEKALSVNPNESLASLLLGTLHAFRGEGAKAVENTDRALRLSPLDPMRYYYESLAATACHSAGQYDRAIALAQSSLRSNRVHPSTWRALTIALVLSGRVDEARQAVVHLRRFEPNLTVEGYLENNPGCASEIGKRWAWALEVAGVPRRGAAA